MLEDNSYLNLYKSRVSQRRVEEFATELALMHNAMGLAIKQLFSLMMDRAPDPNQNHESQIEMSREDPQNRKSSQSSRPKLLKQKKLRTLSSPRQPVEQIEHGSSGKIARSRNIIQQTLKDNFAVRQQELKSNQEVKEDRRTWAGKLDKEIPVVSTMQKEDPFRHAPGDNLHNQPAMDAVDCQQCQQFYSNVGTASKEPRVCNHYSRHKTSVPLTKVKTWSQDFEDV